MRSRTTFLLLGLCISGFAFTLYRAGNQSGTDSGNLWLLTSLIVGVGLIATALAVIAQLAQLRSTNRAKSPFRHFRALHPPRSSHPSAVAGAGTFHADLHRSPRS